MDTPTNTTQRRPGYWLRAIEFRKSQLRRDYRATLGDTAREGISDEDYATTMATLEKMANNLGWDETERPEFGPGGRGFGRGHRHGPFRGEHHHGRPRRDGTRPDQTEPDQTNEA